jgi:protein-disulfide isomerase
MRSNRATVADWGVVVMAVCAVVVTGFVVRQQLRGPSGGSVEDTQVDNWDQYLAGGHRIGRANAPVTIVEFGDYECPFCRRLEPAIRSVLAEYPDDVALVYRYMPISYHEHAYQAARLAECAAQQGRFQQAHVRLYDTGNLGDIVPADFGAAVGVEDPAAFVACANNTVAVPRVDQDVAAAKELDVQSTPTVIVNGLRLGTTPDSVRLFELVQSDLQGKEVAARSM